MTEKTGRTGLSYAASRQDLPGRGTIQPRAGSARDAFQLSRCDMIAAQLEPSKSTAGSGRGSKMVGRQRPNPVLKPSPALSMGADAAAFNSQWEREHRAAFKAMRRASAKAAPRTRADDR